MRASKFTVPAIWRTAIVLLEALDRTRSQPSLREGGGWSQTYKSRNDLQGRGSLWVILHPSTSLRGIMRDMGGESNGNGQAAKVLTAT